MPLVCIAAFAQPVDLREAARLDREGDCAGAEVHYQRALAGKNQSAAVLNNAGNHYLICGDPGKARTYFEELAKLNPRHVNANLQLARIAVGQRRGAAALGYLARVPAASDPAIELLRGEAQHQAGKHDAAARTLGSLSDKSDPAILFALGSVYARIGDYSRAEESFHAVLVQRPDDFNVLLNLGRAAARAGHHERARTALEAALKARPSDADALTELGLVHATSKDYSRAVYLLAQARQQAPDRPTILLALARAAEDAGYYGDSALAYDDYVRMQPGDDAARRDRAHVLALTGARLKEGVAEMRAYVEGHPDDAAGYFNLAQFTWRDQPEESLEQLATAVRLDAGFAPAHVARAWLLHRLGRSAEAAPHLKAALAITPDSVRTLDQLGVVYLTLDQPKEAEAALRRAVEISPTDAEALLHLGRALMALGREEEAQQFLDRYQKARPNRKRDPRREPGMIELATLPEPERRAREIERFRALARSRPDDPTLEMNYASLLLADGQVKEALAEHRRLLTLNGDATIWAAAGRALLEAGQYELAREFLERAAPESPGAQLDLALATFHTSGADAALAAVKEPLKGAHSGDFVLLKAHLLDAAGRSSEARQLLSEGLDRTGARPEIVRDAAKMLARYGSRKEALALLPDKETNQPEIELTRAVLIALLNRTDEAKLLLTKIQARWPEWDQPYVAQGLLLESAQQRKPALEKIRTAIALGSDDGASRCALARLSSSAERDARCTCLAALDRWFLGQCSR
ncbi:MAG: tetratricopeptide repeat protein [Bryobacteraceae bacterium]